MIRAVIFDIDNTLYPYAPCDAAGTAAMREAFSAICGEAVDAAAFSALLQCAKRDVKAHTEGTAACHERLLYAQRLCEVTAHFSAENVLKLYHAYWDAYLASMRAFPGAVQLLRAIKANGVKLGCCTDLTAQIQMRKLVVLGLSDAADAIVTSEESGVEKPDPKPFRMVLEKLGVPASQAVMIGDDYQKDICGATAIGMRAIEYSTSPGHPVAAGDYEALTAILKEWGACR